MTLSEVMRRTVVSRAAQWGVEKGAAADRLLRLGEATQQALEAPSTSEATNRAALWKHLNRLFLDEAMDFMERKSYVEEFAEVIGQETAESQGVRVDSTQWVATGALEIINWLRQERIPVRWRRRVYDYLDVVWTFNPSALAMGVTLKQFFDED